MDPTSVPANINHVDNSPPRLGWTSGPSGRGTLDIVWSCSITIFLCSWSILCLNVPGPGESRFQVLWRKLSLTILGIMCPEVPFAVAFCQWLQVRQAVKDFANVAPRDSPALDERTKSKRLKGIFSCTGLSSDKRATGQWTMKEAFFAEMGGFRLHTKDYDPFPLDAQQIYYLVSKRHMDLPTLSKGVIEDKNKSDALLRAITLCQILWFLVNVIGRWAQNLAVTTFELTTVSFIVCSSMTALFWWYKPADVVLPVNIDSDISIPSILQAENQTFTSWNRTPLDFVSREEWWASKCWSNFVNILRNMRISFGSDVIPVDRLGDTQVKAVSKLQQFIAACLTCAYLAVLFAGWDHDFPTSVERTLWRAVCCIVVGCVVLITIDVELTTFWDKYRISERIKTKIFGKIPHSEKPKKDGQMLQGLTRALDHIRNNSAKKDPAFYVPLKVILTFYVAGVLYCHARLYIFVADFIELRSLPASAYATVDWPKFWPHLA